MSSFAPQYSPSTDFSFDIFHVHNPSTQNSLIASPHLNAILLCLIHRLRFLRITFILKSVSPSQHPQGSGSLEPNSPIIFYLSLNQYLQASTSVQDSSSNWFWNTKQGQSSFDSLTALGIFHQEDSINQNSVINNRGTSRTHQSKRVITGIKKDIASAVNQSNIMAYNH